MRKISHTLLLILFTLITSCGYSPLLKKDSNIYIKNIVFEGDRSLNNLIAINLKKYRKINNGKEYDLKISTNYEKNIVDRDKNGNPKNYNIKIALNLIATNSEKIQLNKYFKRETSLSAQSNKIYERNLEKEYKKDLSRLLVEDIVFFLTVN